MNGRQLGKPQEHLYFHALHQKDVTKSFSCIEPLWPSASRKHVFIMLKRVAAPAKAIAQFAMAWMAPPLEMPARAEWTAPPLKITAPTTGMTPPLKTPASAAPYETVMAWTSKWPCPHSIGRPRKCQVEVSQRMKNCLIRSPVRSLIGQLSVPFLSLDDDSNIIRHSRKVVNDMEKLPT